MTAGRMATLAVVLAVTAGPLVAQRPVAAGDDVEVMLQAAMHKEQVEGRLPEAIEAYKAVVAKAGANKAVAARALLQLARTYERLGRPEARATYGTIVRDYADQPAAASAARARLGTTEPSRRQSGSSSPRLVRSGLFRNAQVSADGRFALGGVVGPQAVGSLVLEDLLSGQTVLRVEGRGAPTVAAPTAAALSPDGRQVAYLWLEQLSRTSTQLVSSLRVIGVEPGATHRIVVAPDPQRSGEIQPIGWSLDSQSVLIVQTVPRQAATLVWVDSEDGSIRPVATLSRWTFAGTMGLSPQLSPNGLFVAYSGRAAENSADVHIFVLDLTTGAEQAVVRMAGQNMDPVWSADGQHLVFVSDRSGSRALWSVRVSGLEAQGEPSLIRRESVSDLVGMSSAGDLYYQQVQQTGQHVFVAERQADGLRITQTMMGEGVAWSPDGRSLAFYRRNIEQKEIAVVVRSLDTGAERSFVGPNIGGSQIRWMPDGSALLVAGDGAFHLLNPATGAFTQLMARDTPEHFRGNVGEISPDGKTLFLHTRPKPGGRITGIVAVDLATGVERRLASFPDPGLPGASAPGLAVSPDGATLVAQVMGEDPSTSRLLEIKTDGSGYRELHGPFPSTFNASIVHWSHDGQSILFFEARRGEGTWRLMQLPAGGGTPQPAGLDSTRLNGSVPLPRLTPTSPLSLDLSPDGQRLVFAGQRFPSSELWALDNLMSLLNSR